MSFPWIPVAVGCCVIIAIGKTGRRKDYGVMTPERKSIYQAALSGSLKNAADLRKLAAAFHEQGLIAQAAMLDKRAALKERTPERKAAHDMAFRRALVSTDRHGIIEIANAFASIGATGAAAKLMMRAAGLPDPSEVAEEMAAEEMAQQEQAQEQAADVSPAADETPAEQVAPAADYDGDEPPPIRISGTITGTVTPDEPAESRPRRQPAAALAESSTIPTMGEVIVTEGHAAN